MIVTHEATVKGMALSVGIGAFVAGFIAIGLLLSGCTDPVILMKNPQTNQMARCQGDPARNFNPADGAEACARAYEQAGFQRVGGF